MLALRIWTVIALVAAPGMALADVLRLAVVVGNNVGAEERQKLRFAENDARKIAMTLTEVADFGRDNVFILEGAGADEVRGALAKATRFVRSFKHTPADKTLLVFYYSGHSDGTSLELGIRDRLSFDELRSRLDAVGSDVTLSFMDACYSGAALRKRGGQVVDPFEVKVNDELESRGSVTITSSASDEATLEADDVEGSYFTHHLVSGLRGGADRSGDGVVTLSELYTYAYEKTVYSSAMTLGGTHHPSYEFSLQGKGDINLATLSDADASVELPAAAKVTVRRREGGRVLAELDSTAPRYLALAAGAYDILLRRDALIGHAEVRVRANEHRRVEDADFVFSQSSRIAMRGANSLSQVIDKLEEESRRRKRRLNLSLGWARPLADDVDNALVLDADYELLRGLSLGVNARAARRFENMESSASLSVAWVRRFDVAGFLSFDLGARVRGGMAWQSGSRSGSSYEFAGGPVLRIVGSTPFESAPFVEARADTTFVEVLDEDLAAEWTLFFRPSIALGYAWSF